MSSTLARSAAVMAARAELLQGRSKTQKKVIKYFWDKGGCTSGCKSKTMSDSEFDQLIMAKRSRIDDKLWALKKLGLEESQVSERPPIHIEGYNFPDSRSFSDSTTSDVPLDWKVGKDGIARSPSYSITWLFFSDEQVFLYTFTFRMDCDDTDETTKEFFYDDVTSLTVHTYTIERMLRKGCLGKNKIKENVNVHTLAIHVPNDSFRAFMQGTPENMQAINAMKYTLRDKKLD